MSVVRSKAFGARTICCVAGWLALAGIAAAAESGAVTIEGEIVDPSAYLQHGRHGADAAGDTSMAIDAGQTLAVLDEAAHALYLLLPEEPGEDPNELAYAYTNQRVRLTGAVFERDGLRGLIVKAIQPLTPPAETPPALEAPTASPDTTP